MSVQHLSQLIERGVSQWPAMPVLKQRNQQTRQWTDITWTQLKAQVEQCANALAVLGVAEDENVGIFAQNMPESFAVDFANFYNRAVSVPLYATSSSAQVQYIVNDASIKVLFVGEQYQYDTTIAALTHCPTLRHVVIYDHAVTKNANDTISVYFDEFLEMGKGLPQNDLVNERRGRANDQDLACLIYTSGTTGEPKGVMLTHANVIEDFRTHHMRLAEVMIPGDVSMGFLPLTHVFERGWSYICLYEGITIAVNRNPADIRQTIKEVHPTHMCSVPRFWEKVFIGVKQKIAESPAMLRSVMEDALKVGREHNVNYVCKGLTPPLWLRMKYKFYEKTVIKALHKELGLERGKLFPTAGAAVSTEVCEFVHSVGINMCVGYGLTESTATVSCFPLDKYVIGSVGELVDGIEVKIGENNEVLLRGKTIMRGYYNKPEATAKAFDADGFFHTGDAGRLEGRTLYLTERLKDLMKTSNGKYISPQAIESRLAIDRYIDQVAVIADGRKFVSALIVPDYKALADYAAQQNIEAGSNEALVNHPQVVAMMRERINTLQQEFAHYEQIKSFVLLSKPFSMKEGELTNTLKLRRGVVAEHYKDIIDKLYLE